MYKICFKCNRLLPLLEYYKHSKMADGHLNKCKECTKQDVHIYSANNIDKIQDYDRTRPNHDTRIKNNRERIKKLKELDPTLYSENLKNRQGRYRDRFPEKYKAHSSVNNAIRDGILLKRDLCENCGSQYEVQAHHESYEELRWLDVIWLCGCCHKKRHKVINEHIRNREEVIQISIPF